MTDSPAKDIIKEYFCTKKSVIYFPDEIDFQIFQNAYIQIMSPDSFTKTMKTSRKLIDIQTYAQFKEIILKTHKELLHPGIDKLTLQFKELYYYPNYQKLIQNIINECEICNIAKTEHRNTKLTLETTPDTFSPRDKYYMDFTSRELHVTHLSSPGT